MMIKNLYDYRELLKSNVKKEIRGKYKGSFLGVLWSFINPLLMVLVYALVFPFILKMSEDNYLIFLIVAMIPWNFFTTVISQGTVTVLANAGIIKKVYFPREILPISVVISGTINFLVSAIIICFFLIFSGVGFSWYALLFPVILFIQVLLSLGIIFILSALDIYVRDVEYIVNFIIMLLFYATPIIYSPTLFPENIRWLLYLNPMAVIVTAYRDILYYQQLPDIQSLVILFVISAGICFMGYKIFKKLEKGFAEQV